MLDASAERPLASVAAGVRLFDDYKGAVRAAAGVEPAITVTQAKVAVEIPLFCPVHCIRRPIGVTRFALKFKPLHGSQAG